jgi:hypothetical protein
MRGHQPPGFTAQQDDDGDPKTGQFRGKIPMISETYTLNAPVIARWIIARMKQDQKDPPNLPLLIVDDLEAELIAALDGLSFPLIVSRWAGQPPPEPEVRIVSPRAGETVTMEIGLRIFAEHLGEGTLQVLVDQPTVPVGQAIEEKPWRAKLESNARSLALLLEPGPHRISVQVADARGLATSALDSVEITVQADVEVVPHVFISSPENGDAVRTRFEVNMEASDVIIEPALGVRRENAGHFFLAVDTEPPAPGERVEDRQGLKNLVGGEHRLTLIVSPGRHVLIVGVADGTNVALEPRDRIEVFGF